MRLNGPGKSSPLCAPKNTQATMPSPKLQLGEGNYTKIHANLTRSLILPDTIAPCEWGIWANLTNRYNLYGNGSLEEWADWAIKLQNPRVWNPSDQPTLGNEEISALDDHLVGREQLILLWQATLCFFERKQRGQLPLRIDLINMEVGALLRKIQKTHPGGHRNI